MEQLIQVYLLLLNILKMKFNNAKLSIGILYIGVIVLASIIALYFQIENHIILHFGNTIKTVYVYIFFIIIFTLPFDIFSHIKLNPKEEKKILEIISANIILFLIFILYGSIVFYSYHKQSLSLCILLSTISQLMLLPLQELSIKTFMKGKSDKIDGFSLIIIPEAPSYMTMNILRTFKDTIIVVPKHWTRQNFKNYKFHLERFKLNIKKKNHIRSYIFSIVINTILFIILYSYYSNTNISAVAFTIKVSLIFNIIGFVYILILPTLSQRGIYNIDNIMKKKDLNLFKENLNIYEENQDKNYNRSKAVESIFYPIPSTQSRLNSKIEKNFGLPNISRIIIFFASFSLSIIFKGVHGNAGKIGNWILPPSE